jgi:hypothetical protein
LADSDKVGSSAVSSRSVLCSSFLVVDSDIKSQLLFSGTCTETGGACFYCDLLVSFRNSL